MMVATEAGTARYCKIDSPQLVPNGQNDIDRSGIYPLRGGVGMLETWFGL